MRRKSLQFVHTKKKKKKKKKTRSCEDDDEEEGDGISGDHKAAAAAQPSNLQRVGEYNSGAFLTFFPTFFLSCSLGLLLLLADCVCVCFFSFSEWPGVKVVGATKPTQAQLPLPTISICDLSVSTWTECGSSSKGFGFCGFAVRNIAEPSRFRSDSWSWHSLWGS